MTSFNYSLYDYGDTTPYESSKIKEKPASTFNFDLYETPYEKSEEEKMQESATKDITYQQYAVNHKTPEELKKLSATERREYIEDLAKEREYLSSAGFTKALLSEMTLGATEKIPILKPQEHEQLVGFGRLIGAAWPIGLTYKAISLPFKALDKIVKFGKYAQAGINTVTSVATGAAIETGKEAIAGEGFDPEKIATEGAIFGVLDGLFRSIPVAWNWVKSLKPAQQSQMLIEGIIPEGLSPNQYKFYEKEVVPELQKVAEQEYKSALENATEENNREFQNKIANIKAQHEQDLYQRSQAQQLSQEEFTKAKLDYENKLKQTAAEHQSKIEAIEKQNQEAQTAFEIQQKEFQQMKARQQAVQNAINPQEGGQPLVGRVSIGAEDIPYRPSPPITVNPSLENRVGSVISPNEITNTTNAGRANMAAVRANDAIDYQNVRDAYTLSEKLNAQVETAVPNLINELRETQRQLTSVPKLSPPQEQLLTVVNSLLERTAVLGPEGTIIRFKPITNNILEEQAKALRYFMDFNFEHGNTRGIFTPTVNQIEDAIHLSAHMVGNIEAANANQRARTLYRQWAQDYDNPYIRLYRDTANREYSKRFKDSLDFDEFNVLNNILSRSNAGQQLSGSTRRALVEKHLAKFMEDPRKVNPREFDKTLRELGAVISPQEEQSIRQQFNEARRTPVIRAKKMAPAEKPELPKLKELTTTKIPLFTKEENVIPEITEVKVPLKSEIKPTQEMKAASKMMNITPEQARKMTDTPTGIKELREKLSKTEAQKKLFDNIGKTKVKDILYEGKVERTFTGDELYNIINKGDNYALLAEILGEDTAANLLVSSKEIASKKVTVETLKKVGVKTAYLKALLLFGVL